MKRMMMLASRVRRKMNKRGRERRWKPKKEISDDNNDQIDNKHY